MLVAAEAVDFRKGIRAGEHLGLFPSLAVLSEQRRFLPPLGEQSCDNKTQCISAQVKNHHRKEIFTPDKERHDDSATDQTPKRKTPPP